jgi:hypothetical protein
MLRDVFYYGNKPNVHPREKFATSLEDARHQSTTEHFWIINEYCDYQNFDWDFDFEFLPDEDVWAEEHNNVWPSQHQKDSGTWLCSSEYSEVIIYRADVEPVKRKNIKNKFWILSELIDETTFDFSWHPDPTEPDYIYEFGTQWHDRGGPRYVPESIVRLSSGEPIGQTKYVTDVVATLIQNKSKWIIPDNIDVSDFDFSWVPHPDEQPYIHQFGTQWQKTGGPSYEVEGATEVKYINLQRAISLPNKDNWEIAEGVVIADFDFSWHHDETDEPYIYVFGNNQYPAEVMATVTYLPADAVKLPSGKPIGRSIKYISNIIATLGENKTNWIVPDNIDTTEFDFSWIPDPHDEAFIYQFGTQWQKTGGPKYITPGVHKNSAIKYIDTMRVKKLPNKDNFNILDSNAIADFDYSWHHDETDEPYIYIFGNNQYPAEIMPTIEYIPEGSIKLSSGKAIGQKKYVTDIVATLGENKTYWEIPDDVDTTNFDFSWVPNPHDGEYIYQFGTQWQKTGGPKYMSPKLSALKESLRGAFKAETKYIDTQRVRKLPNKDKFTIVDGITVSDFDYSWHHDETDEPYIYIFGNNQYPAEIMPTIEYAPVDAIKLSSGKTIGQKKYVTDIVATLGENKTYWDIPDNVDTTGFDFSWVPNPHDGEYIYQFGTQWQKTGGPKYMSPELTALKEKLRGGFKAETKYIDTQRVRRLPNKNNFSIIDGITVAEFDYSWHHDETDEPYIYIFGNNQYSAEIMPTIEYSPSDAVRLSSGKAIGQKKYVTDIVARLGENKTNWIIPDNIDISEFDFSWVPNPHDNEYIYQFGTQHQKTGGPKYMPPELEILKEKLRGAFKAEIKYVDGSKAKRLPNKDNFQILGDVVISDFDYSWHPDETETESYIYVFGNNLYSAEVMPTVQYILGDSVGQIKYVNDIVARLGVNKTYWDIPNNIDVSEFDFSWIPHPQDTAYVHQFGTQWQKTGGPRYLTKELNDLKEKLKGGFKSNLASLELFNVEIKYVDTPIAKILPDRTNWIVPEDIDSSKFDFSWHPDETEKEPYIYQFGTQHQKTGGPQFIANGIPRLASGKPIGQVKFIDVIKSKKLASKKHWSNVKNTDTTFDFSWHPDDTDPPTTYQFGTLIDRDDGPKYTHPDILDDVLVYMQRIEKTVEDDIHSILVPRYEIETTLEDLVNQHPNEIFWAMHKNIDYENFNFDWRPEIVNVQWENEYVYVFGSPDSEITQTYFVNANMYTKGNKDFKFIQTEELTEKYLASLFKKSDMFFVDRSNSESQTRFEKLKQKFPNIQKTRYLNSWVDTINRCINRSTTELCWILNSELDYNDFDFEYYPNPWQMKMIQVFGTQWSHWGTTFMVNRETFAQDTKHIKIIEHLSNLNFVRDRKAKATNVLYDIIYIDHGNMDMSHLKGNTIIKYQDSYIATFQKLLDMLPVKKEHYIWLVSTICDYKDFDFTYICDPFAKEQLHVFPSDRQKFGDTFLIDVNKLRTLIEDMNVLEDYVKVNYNQSQRAKRLPAPVIITETDTHVGSINTEFSFPYAIFTTKDNQHIDATDSEPMSLWSPETKNIQITSVGGTRIVVPKEAKEYVKRELYDYPYIITNSRLEKSSPMDIVFLSNGETGADENYQHLLKVTTGLSNRIVRVDGVNGRVAAYHAAAEASNTPWMFTVFAKLKVSNKFDWNWQPDRLQLPKHYVFHATNPVNGLKYGHMAMIAYNKKLTLANEGKGLDFTMDDEHEVLEINSGTANFNTDEWSTWRTAFREALKLRTTNDEISKNRLEFWLTVGSGKFSQYSIDGATDAVQYYEEVNGDFDKLKLSYDWPWLKTYYETKYKL